MIDIENLTKRFGDLIAVDNLTLHVDDGEVFGFLGPNGAGKTTLLECSVVLFQRLQGKQELVNTKLGIGRIIKRSGEWLDYLLKMSAYTRN